MSQEGNGIPPVGGSVMRTASTEVDVAGAWVKRVEDIEAARQGRTIPEVRRSIARRISTTASVLRHLRERRRKSVPAWLMSAIRGVLIEVLQSEVRALEHEIHLHLQTSGGHRSDALENAEAQVVKAKQALSECIKE